jgi:hypothetical protein
VRAPALALVGLLASSPALARAAEPDPHDLVLDPENAPQPTATQPQAAPPPAVAAAGAELVVPTLALRLDSGFDTHRDGDSEVWHHDQLRGDASLALRRPGRLSASLAVRWRWRREVRDPQHGLAPVLEPDGRGTSAAPTTTLSELDLRDARLTLVLPADQLLTLGVQSIRWGVSDFMMPADLLQPQDLRSGVALGPDDARIPTLAVRHQWVRGPWSTDLVLIPFFEPNRVEAVGGDLSLLSSAVPLVPPSLRALAAPLVDPANRDLVSRLFTQTERPAPTLANVSLGARVGASVGGADLGVSGLWGWDRVPAIDAAPTIRELIARGIEVAATGEGAVAEIQTAELLALLGSDEPIYRAHYARRLSVAVDAVRYVGPVGVRLESVWSPERTLLLEDGQTVRRASLFSTLGIGGEPMGGRIAWGVEAFLQHNEVRSGERPVIVGDDFYGCAGGVAWDDAAVEGRGLTARLGGLLDAGAADVALLPSLSWTLSGGTQLGLRARWQVNGGSRRLSLGDLARGDDEWIAHLQQSW